MGALANAAALARNNTFRDQALAATVYNARLVIQEVNIGEPVPPSSYTRFNFARQVLLGPAGYIDSVAWTLACDPAIATVATAGNPALVSESLLLNTVENTWDYLARTVFG